MRCPHPGTGGLGRGKGPTSSWRIVITIALFFGCTNPSSEPGRRGALSASPSPNTQPFEVLIFSKTTAFRHEAIPEGIKAIEQLGKQHGFLVESTEDASRFAEAELAQFKAVIFLSTSGDVLDKSGESAFEKYIGAGGGYVGIHSATDTEYEWSWYSELVGAQFKNHPEIQQATVNVIDRTHPSTSSLPTQWVRTDEWYDFRASPRGKVHVLLALDESTYSGGEQGPDHPIGWCRNYKRGRSWYTAGGHSREAFNEALFLEHVLGGIYWAAGARQGDCGVN